MYSQVVTLICCLASAVNINIIEARTISLVNTQQVPGARVAPEQPQSVLADTDIHTRFLLDEPRDHMASPHWSAWSDWTTGGSGSFCMAERHRACSSSYNLDCRGDATQFRTFNVSCKDVPQWSAWNPWMCVTSFDGTCYSFRERFCSTGQNMDCLEGIAHETAPCTAEVCPGSFWLDWGDWKCDETAKSGVCLMGRIRNCSTGNTSDCRGYPAEVKPCQPDICSEPSWLPWSDWECMHMTGICYMRRFRNCSTGRQADCTNGSHADVQLCNTHICLDANVPLSTTTTESPIQSTWKSTVITALPGLPSKSHPNSSRTPIQSTNAATHLSATSTPSLESSTDHSTRSSKHVTSLSTNATLLPNTSTDVIVNSTGSLAAVFSETHTKNTTFPEVLTRLPNDTQTTSSTHLTYSTNSLTHTTSSQTHESHSTTSKIRLPTHLVVSSTQSIHVPTHASKQYVAPTRPRTHPTQPSLVLSTLSTSSSSDSTTESPLYSSSFPIQKGLSSSNADVSTTPTLSTTSASDSTSASTMHTATYSANDGSLSSQSVVSTSSVTNGEWSPWYYGACSVTCGVGTKRHIRRCSTGNDADCSGSSVKTETCEEINCPVNGGWGSWSSWSACSHTCGNGVSLRRRSCDSPIPQNGGTDCAGASLETDHCIIVAYC